jgi:hypothetical protein
MLGGVYPPETTGRQIVVFADADDDAPVDWGRAGIANVADSRDFASGDVTPENASTSSYPAPVMIRLST